MHRLLLDTTAKGLHRRNYTRSSNRGKAWELKPEADWVTVPVEPIVADELWDRCEAILTGQRSRAKPIARGAVHLFAGLAHCSCGTRMYVKQGSPKYVCEGCRNKIPMQDLEDVFLSELHRFLLSPAELAGHARATDEAIREKERLIEQAQAAMRKIEAEEAHVFDLYHAGQIARDDFGRHHRPISERRRQLDAELPRLEAELDVMRISALSQEEAVQSARTVAERWPALSDAEKRQMVEATTSRIVVGTEEIEIDLVSLPQASLTESNRQNAMQLQAFRVFGPKVIAMREHFADLALESRFLTGETSGRPLRPDVPIHLPASFAEEARELRNALLAWRFRSRFSVGPDPSRAASGIGPRYRQSSLALLSLVVDAALREQIGRELAGEEARVLRERADTFEAAMLSASARRSKQHRQHMRRSVTSPSASI